MNNDAEKCLQEIIHVCDKFGFVLAHEDDHGSFILMNKEGLKPETIKIYHDWLKDATCD